MAGKAPPCITMMLCVAGCSTTSTGELPHSRTLPPPNFDVNGTPARTTQPVWDRQPVKRAASTPKAPLPTTKPVSIEVPMPVLADKRSNAPVLATQFEAVPDSYLKTGSTASPQSAEKPFFTPLPLAPIAPSTPETQVVDANALLGLLVTEMPPNSVVIPEPIPYPQYVSVGPEYFGIGSDIAPYVIDPNADTPLPENQYTLREPVALRPQWPVAEANEGTGEYNPVPRRRPSRPLPEEPAPEIQIAAIVPPRPEPSPKRAPSDPIPRSPARTTADRVSGSTRRSDPQDEAIITTALPRAKPLRDVEPDVVDTPQYRVRLDPVETPAENVFASLNAEPPILTVPLPDLSVVSNEEQARDDFYPPLPRRKPPQRASVRVSGKTTNITPDTSQAIATQPANDSAAQVNCLVSLGSNDRMILICEGIDVSQAHVFRAVVEGESAMRGLRRFDATDQIVASYGFNAERFHAMSQGPRSARDLAFLRALRKSGKSVRVKGRDFEMYLMKGDNRLATVLVEQVTTIQPLNAVGQ